MGNLKTLKIVTIIFDNYLSIAIYFFLLDSRHCQRMLLYCLLQSLVGCETLFLSDSYCEM